VTVVTVQRLRYDAKTAAQLLSCSERQVQVYRERGLLTGYMEGGRYGRRYYTHAELEALAAWLEREGDR
jgi:DNA-binding transcriptional MerR regulator